VARRVRARRALVRALEQPPRLARAPRRGAAAYVTLIGGGIAAYRPMVGLTRTVEIPGLQKAHVKEGILYAVVDDLPDGFLLKAIQEPT